ncbi:hypothetical protein FIBSPDRAFT_1044902 [Athelia psychrophila]|uniref:F-box domain-containing protein n=1 Tax=Athelia psychrophila TaxID=1759441 RepID=A0A166IWA1_9AGAM|nr:hypothetical protein FIBSPDRAFT_1044902 [Fibularhizoctonia sp. CBS 109695]
MPKEVGAEFNAAWVSAITNESLLLYKWTADDSIWDFGLVPSPACGVADDYSGLIVSSGPIVMVQTSALSILLYASFGRMSARRFWRLMMMTLRTTKAYDDIIPGIDYGVLMHENYVWLQDPSGTICMSEEESNSRIKSCPMLTDAASSSLTSARKLSSMENVPQELLVLISAQLPLHTFLTFSSAPRHLRHKLLGTDSDHNAFAWGWVTNTAPWYLPLSLHPSLQGAWKKSDYHEQEDEEFTLPKRDVATLDWDYLRRHPSSGSMRNRKRIWNVAKQLEKKADELGI